MRRVPAVHLLSDGAPVYCIWPGLLSFSQGWARSASVEKEKPPEPRNDRGLQVTLASRTGGRGEGGPADLF
jgi:hypothetical protein